MLHVLFTPYRRIQFRLKVTMSAARKVERKIPLTITQLQKAIDGGVCRSGLA